MTESHYDAVVIGGGIIGCSIAWRLAQAGQRVAVLERGHVGGEASSAAAGVLTPKATPDIPRHVLDFRATSSDVGYNKDVVFGSVVGLFERVARFIPSLRQARFLETWAGLRPMSPDREPVLGADAHVRGLYWATGHLGNGIVEAPATARAVADLITTGKSSIPIDRFGPERFATVGVR